MQNYRASLGDTVTVSDKVKHTPPLGPVIPHLDPYSKEMEKKNPQKDFLEYFHRRFNHISEKS